MLVFVTNLMATIVKRYYFNFNFGLWHNFCSEASHLYTIYPIVPRAWPRPSALASKSILHTSRASHWQYSTHGPKTIMKSWDVSKPSPLTPSSKSRFQYLFSYLVFLSFFFFFTIFYRRFFNFKFNCIPKFNRT